MPIPPAEKCQLVVSSWVYQFGLTCKKQLLVQFKHHMPWAKTPKVMGGVPGVTCLYPKAPPNLYALGVASPSPGHFVHVWLYKKQAYQLIASPCPAKGCTVTVPCCAGPLMKVVTLTLVNRKKGAVGLPGTLKLTWDQDLQVWQWKGTLCGVAGVTVTAACMGTREEWFILSGTAVLTPMGLKGTCDPLYALFASIEWLVCDGTADVILTV